MGLFDKLKEVLFEEEVIEEPIETPVKVEVKNEAPLNIPKINRNEEKKKVEEYDASSETDRELFNSERTFDFPSFDEDEFEDLMPKKKVEPKLEEKERTVRERVVERERRIPESSVAVKVKNEDSYDRYREYSSTRINKVNSTPVRKGNFKPSPVISPVYGVLDKNYKKEDVLMRDEVIAKPKEKLDVDSVRKKAFGALEEDLEKTMSKPIKELFKDIDEGSKVEVTVEVSKDIPAVEETELLKEAVELEKELDTFLENSVDEEIDVTKEMELPTMENIDTYKVDEEESVEEPEIELAENEEIEEVDVSEFEGLNLPKVEETIEELIDETPIEEDDDEIEKELEDSKDLDDDDESDLFDLIDSMYEDKEDE